MDSAPGAQGHAAQLCAALRDDLGWALGTLFRSYLKAVEDVTGELPGGPRGYQILATAAGGLAGTQLALAQHLGVDRTVMTYLLDDLERAGLIAREPDPTDRRARRITATRLGHTQAAQLQQQLGRVEDDLLAALDPAERTQFRTLLRRLATHAGTDGLGHDACAAAEAVRETDAPATTAAAARARRRRTTA